MSSESFVFLIFGATGDLTSRKLIPALFRLFCTNQLNDKFIIIGCGRNEMDKDAFKVRISKYLTKKDNSDNNVKSVVDFLEHILYYKIDPYIKDEYELLKKNLELIQSQNNLSGNILFYLATPPELYFIIPKMLGDCKLANEAEGKYWRRIIIEKPYGHDYESAIALDKIIKSNFKESQIYRIDHYLGKETVQNMLVFRFSNEIFEPLWNRNYINYIEITAVENMGVLDRGQYYDGAGALRDMVQNHLMQLLGLIAMEPPAKFNALMFRDEISKVVESIRPITVKDVAKNVIRGQYLQSKTPDSKNYRDENHIQPDSRTETFVAMRLFIDNWRWSGVPFYIRTGKAMPTKVSEVVIHFKSTPYQMFEKQCSGSYCNKLVIRILPDEGMLLQFGLKMPGSGFNVKQVSMDFKYDKMSNLVLSEAYEKLILDCIIGDEMMFSRSDTVDTSWKFIDPILKAWKTYPDIPLYGYPFGTWGPVEADQLLTDGRVWSNPCKNLTNTDSYCLL